MADGRLVTLALSLVLAACELGVHSAHDATSPGADAGGREIDASLGSSGRFSIGGRLEERFSGRAIVGAEICAEPGPCVRTDAEARWRLDDVFSESERGIVSLDHPGMLPVIVHFEPTRSRTNLLLGMYDLAALNALIESFGASLDPALGGLSVLVVDAFNLRVAGLEGVTFELSAAAEGPLYPEPDVGFAVDATTISGSGVWFNAEPGMHVLSVHAEGRICTAGLRWTGSVPNELPVLIRPGTESVVFLICPRAVADGETCTENDACSGPGSACLVGPERDVCEPDVGGCPTGPTCTGGVLLNRCLHGQARGFDCAGFGARCDREASACVDLPIESRCGVGLHCAEGLACTEGRCETALPCASVLDCVSACERDVDCEAGCVTRTSGDSQVLYEYLEACAGAAGCPALVSCAGPCPAEHHACVSDR